VGVQETPRRDHVSGEEDGGLSRFEHHRFLISHFLFHLPAVGSKPLDGNIRFVDVKGASILEALFAVSAALAGEKSGVEDHNGSGGRMQGEEKKMGRRR